MQQNKVFFLSSAQADLKDLSTGQATWFFSNPIEFANAQMGLVEFSFTNWFINISAALANNKLYYSDDPLDPTKYLITIPDGSYSLTALSDFLTSEQQAALGQVIFSLQPNYSTNKCGILFGNIAGWYVSFSAGTCYAINGFALNQFVPAGKSNTAFYIEYGANTASFNNITALQVSCDLTTDSISNGKSSSVIYQTSPTSEVGATQSDRPNNVVYCTLTNTRFSSITIRITDQSDNAVTLSEDFSVSLIVRY
jgi:hypothetical protein